MANIITGTDAGESISGTAGDDEITALGGSDSIRVTRGHDDIDGGAGLDLLHLHASALGLGVGPHRYTIGANRLFDLSGVIDTNFANIETLQLTDDTPGDVTLDASALVGVNLNVGVQGGTHDLLGSAGGDTFGVNGGSGTIDGGAGSDWVAFNVNTGTNAAAIVASLAGGAMILAQAGGPSLNVRNVEQISFGAYGGGGLSVDGSALGVALMFGQTGFADTFIGGTGNDSLIIDWTASGQGDVLTGGAGADSFGFGTFAAFGGATITDFSRPDRIDLRAVLTAVQFIGTAGFSGTAGEVRYTSGGGQTLLIGDADGDGTGESVLTLPGSFGLAETAPGSGLLQRAVTQITGTEDRDTIDGTDADETILALGGHDMIGASRGQDVIDGGAGEDGLWVLAARLNLPAGAHDYTITGDRITDVSGGLDTSFTGIENIFLDDRTPGGVAIDASAALVDLNLVVWAGAHDVAGGAGGDQISVRGGSGTFDGAGGDDWLWVERDNSTNGNMLFVTEAGGVTTLTQAGSASLTARNFETLDIVGTGGAMRVDASAVSRAIGFSGTAWADTIIGSTGANQIDSRSDGLGTGDVFTGGGGNDWFTFWTFAGLAGATITDFSRGDQIDLHLISNARFIGSAAFSGVAGEIRYSMTAGQTQLIGDANGDGIGDSVLTLSNRAMALREIFPGSKMLQVAPNVITGTNARDILSGSTGDDDILALGGPDAVRVSRGIDTVDGGAGTDMLELDASTLALAAGPHGYVLTPGRLVDTSNAVDTSFVGIEQVRLFDLGGNDVTVDASALTGVTLDVIVRAGTHSLTGSGGTDTFYVSQSGSGTIDGGAGADTLVFASDNSINTHGLIVTQAGGATILAQAGGSNLSVRDVETLQIAASAGGLNVDASASSVGLRFLLSNAADVAKGGIGADVFSVTSAANGAGDVWTGGGGADLFSFTGIAAFSGTITDLDASDTLQVTGLAPNGSFIGGQEFSGVEGQFRYVSGSGLTALLGDADGDMVADSMLLITNGAFVLAETSPTPGILRIVGQLPANDVEANVVTGTDGVDYLDGGEGNDTIDGRGGADIINGGDDDDHIDGGAGRDIIHGGYGDDTLDGGADGDSVFGDDGDDTITAAGATGTDGEGLSGGYGNDTITAANGLYRLIGDVGGSTPDDGNDRLTLTGGASGSWVAGGGGDDVLSATGTGTVTLNGGTGDDEISVGGFTSGHVSLGTGNDTLRILSGGGFTLDMAETFGSGRDRVAIQSTIGMLVMGLDAGEQGDVLDLSAYGANPFGTGVLTIAQEAIDTVIRVVATGASIRLQNTIAANLSAYNLGVANPLFAPRGMTINDAFAENPAIDYVSQLTGADGDDTIRGFGGNDTLLGSGGADRLEGGLGADLLDGGSGNDWLDGGDGDDVLQGGAGDDRIDSFAGVDTIRGGTGDDRVIVNNVATQVLEAEGEGTDTVETHVSYTLAAGSAIEQLVAGNPLSTTDIALIGNEFSNTIVGNAGANLLAGEDGHDWLQGGGGNDVLAGGEGHDSLWGGDGDDQLRGGDGDDTLFGGAGIDTASYADAGAAIEIDLSFLEEQLTRGAGTDTLVSIENVIGSGLDDVLAGGAGANVLTGGAGNDRFVFGDTAGSARDTIADFTAGDRVDLSLIDANGAAAGDAAFAFIGAAGFGGVAGQLRVTGAGTSWLVEGDSNGDRVADFSIAVTTLAPGLGLAASDFLL